MKIAIVRAADAMKPGESLLAEDWVDREPGESLKHFRARKEIDRLQALNRRDRERIRCRVEKIARLMGLLQPGESVADFTRRTFPYRPGELEREEKFARKGDAS